MTFHGSPITQAFQNMNQSHSSTQVHFSHTPLLPPNHHPTTVSYTGTIPSFEYHLSNTVTDQNAAKKQLQKVLRIAQRTKIVRWMIEQVNLSNTDKHIGSHAVKNFPTLFNSSEKGNNIKAFRLWKGRHTYVDETQNGTQGLHSTSITRTSANGLRRLMRKARDGRGRNTSDWVLEIHKDLVQEFDRLRKARLNLNGSLFREIALRLTKENRSEHYSRHTVDPRSQKSITDMISSRWIQSFMKRNQIVSSKQTGKILVSMEKQTVIEKEVAYHLGCLKRQFDENLLDEDDVGNADETNFLINMDNHRTFGPVGDQHIKYADVMSGTEGMTMMIRLSRGRNGEN